MHLIGDAHPIFPWAFCTTSAAKEAAPAELESELQNAAVGHTGPFHSPSISIAFFANVVSTISSYFGVLPSLILPTLVIKSAVKLTRSGLNPLLASQMHSLTMKSKLSERIFSGYPVCLTRIGMILALSVYMIRVASILAETTACTISG